MQSAEQNAPTAPPLRVLHLSTEGSWRGGEQQIANLIQSLEALGVENFLLARSNSPMETFARERGWRVNAVPFRGSFNLRAARALARYARQQKVQLVHCHTAKGHSLAVLANVLGMHLPLVVHRRVDFPVRKNLLTQWKYNHPSVRRIVCVSDFIAALVRPSVRSPERVITIHSAINPERFSAPPATDLLRSEFGFRPETPVVVNTSALADHKDYPTFLRTAAKLSRVRPDCRFVIFGHGPLEDELRAMQKALGLQQVVHFAGFRRNVQHYLPFASVFLMTSKTEGLGTSILDAFAARVPVVATRAGGIPEMVVNGETGLAAPVGDDAALASAVQRLLQEPPLQKNLTTNAFHRLEQRFTLLPMARKTYSLYQEVALR